MGRPIRIERSKYFVRNRKPAAESAESEVTSPMLNSGVDVRFWSIVIAGNLLLMVYFISFLRRY